MIINFCCVFIIGRNINIPPIINLDRFLQLTDFHYIPRTKVNDMIFNIEKSQYIELLSNCLDDLIKIEEYELCAEVKKILDKKSKKHGDVPVFDQ